MMKQDLERARKTWVKQAKTSRERKKREESDYLAYCDENGLYADFHANRHTFISNLAKAGVSPKVAQTMARHSDIHLTMNVYSHVEMEDQAKAIRELPPPPKASNGNPRRRQKRAADSGGGK